MLFTIVMVMKILDLIRGRATRGPGIRRVFPIYNTLLAILLAVFLGYPAHAQDTLAVQWELLTSGDFVKAISRAQGTCVLPFGILEKHGQQLPLREPI